MAGTEIDPTDARIAALEARIDELEGRTEAPSADALPENAPVSRRRLLGLAGAAAAGAVGATVAAATPAGAVHQPEDIGIDLPNNGVATTILNSSVSSLTAFQVVNTSTGGSTGTTGIDGTIINTAGSGVLGRADGNASQGGIGVRGIGNSGRAVGVYGNAVGDGGSIVAEPPGNAPATSGGHLILYPASAPGPPTGSGAPSQVGSFYMDQAGVLYQCVVSGNPGTWMRQAPLVTLPAPVRVFDSRPSTPNGGGSTQGALTFTAGPPSAAFRDVNCSQAAVGGATVVPAGATTLLLNLAVVTVSGVGALNVYAHGATQPDTANINWSAGGQVLSNAVTSACNAARHVDVAIVASAGASTHFIIDVVGYYR